MGFLKNLFGVSDEEPELLSTKLRRAIEEEEQKMPKPELVTIVEEAKKIVQPQIAIEEEILTKAGSPVPEMTTLSFPRYRIPRYLYFEFIHESWQQEYGRIIHVYVITGSHELLDRAQKDFNNEGFQYLVHNYSGKFFNRDPYHTYKVENGEEPAHWKKPPLEQVYYTPQEIDDIMWRYKLLKDACVDGDQGERYYNSLFPPHPRLFGVDSMFRDKVNTVWKDLPIPPNEIKGETTYFKILPTSQTLKPGIYAQFFNSLKAVKQPIKYEIVATADTVNYFMWCSTHDAPIVKRQLELHFPDFTIIENDDIHAGLDNFGSEISVLGLKFTPSARVHGGYQRAIIFQLTRTINYSA